MWGRLSHGGPCVHPYKIMQAVVRRALFPSHNRSSFIHCGFQQLPQERIPPALFLSCSPEVTVFSSPGMPCIQESLIFPPTRIFALVSLLKTNSGHSNKN